MSLAQGEHAIHRWVSEYNVIVSFVQFCIISAVLGRVNPRREGNADSSDGYLRANCDTTKKMARENDGETTWTWERRNNWRKKWPP